MQLVKSGAIQGHWFTYEVEGEPKPARFKVRRIPSAFDRQTYFSTFGRKIEARRKAGAIIQDTDLEQTQRYQMELAVYALVDSEDVQVPRELLEGAAPETAPGETADALVTLDGRWSESIKRVVFGELPQLMRWVIEQANSLSLQAAKEETDLGKTS